MASGKAVGIPGKLAVPLSALLRWGHNPLSPRDVQTVSCISIFPTVPEAPALQMQDKQHSCTGHSLRFSSRCLQSSVATSCAVRLHLSLLSGSSPPCLHKTSRQFCEDKNSITSCPNESTQVKTPREDSVACSKPIRNSQSESLFLFQQPKYTY